MLASVFGSEGLAQKFEILKILKIVIFLKFCICTYHYGGGHVFPAPRPAIMNEILEAVTPRCGFADPMGWPNSCTLNRYSGSVNLGARADDEVLFRTRS